MLRRSLGIIRNGWGRNGPERSRVNAVNTLLAAHDGTVRHLIDPAQCPRYIEDLEGTATLEGTDGELDKKSDPMRTHITDAAGYLIVGRYPVGGDVAKVYQDTDMWMPVG